VSEAVQCCVVGGGPAGMMAGVLLARRGVKVIVVEKHPDFLRDFRGDTIHPSTLELMHELGWADDFLELPHTEMSDVTVSMDGTAVTFADFRKLKVHCPFIRSRRPDRDVGRRPSADRARGPPGALVPAGIAVHRGCRARHVASRRSWHQPRHPRRGRDGQSDWATPGRGQSARFRLTTSAAPQRSASTDHSSFPDGDPARSVPQKRV
jgi:FAD binding domain